MVKAAVERLKQFREHRCGQVDVAGSDGASLRSDAKLQFIAVTLRRCRSSAVYAQFSTHVRGRCIQTSVESVSGSNTEGDAKPIDKTLRHVLRMMVIWR